MEGIGESGRRGRRRGGQVKGKAGYGKVGRPSCQKRHLREELSQERILEVGKGAKRGNLKPRGHRC